MQFSFPSPCRSRSRNCRSEPDDERGCVCSRLALHTRLSCAGLPRAEGFQRQSQEVKSRAGWLNSARGSRHKKSTRRQKDGEKKEKGGYRIVKAAQAVQGSSAVEGKGKVRPRRRWRKNGQSGEGGRRKEGKRERQRRLSPSLSTERARSSRKRRQCRGGPSRMGCVNMALCPLMQAPGGLARWAGREGSTFFGSALIVTPPLTRKR